MDLSKLFAIALIAGGIVALVYGGITYTKTEDVVNLGPLHVTAGKEKTIPLPPIAGALALVGGVVLLAAGNRKG